MKKSRFLWIRNLPDGCKGTDIRKVLERFGEIQTLRIFKDVHLRHAVIAFMDTNSAIRANSTGIKLSDTLIKPEYCDSLDIEDLIHKLHHPLGRNAKEHPQKPISVKLSVASGASVTCNGQVSRSPLSVSKSVNGRSSLDKPPVNHALRLVQNSFLPPSWRGVKISNLPAPNKLSDEHLRQGLFKEFRCFGRILSVFFPRNASGFCSDKPRDAVITFRRPEDARYACQTLHKSSKLLFSTPIIIEPHRGFETPGDGLSNPSPDTHVAETKADCSVDESSGHSNRSTSVFKLRPDCEYPSTPAATKCPTRTLYVGGLTAGPAGPVTAEHLTAAFRKFGDIIDVQLQCSSNSALIQFAEMRGPLRAMNAHSRDPLRLGGRPLFLAYVPSHPSTGLWFSELPPALACLTDEDLFRKLSQLAPIQEITLIARSDPSTRLQPGQAPSTSVHIPQSPHYAAYIRLASTDQASQLLTDLRCGSHFEDLNQTNPCIPSAIRQRRIIAVDFASSRQTTLVNSLRLSAARSGGSPRIRVISSILINRAKETRTSTLGDQPSSHDPVTAKSSVNRSSLSEQCLSKSNVCATSNAVLLMTDKDCSPLSDGTKPSQVHVDADVDDPQPFLSGKLGQVNRMRDSSPSSLSTTSSSSLSSESSSSTTSSSTSSVSSCTSSGSSTRSKSHRSTQNQNFRSKSSRAKALEFDRNVRVTAISDAVCSNKASGLSTTAERSSTITNVPPLPSRHSPARTSFSDTSVRHILTTVTTTSSSVLSSGCPAVTIGSMSVPVGSTPSTVLTSFHSSRTRVCDNTMCSTGSLMVPFQNSEIVHRTTLSALPSTENCQVTLSLHSTPFTSSSGVTSSCQNCCSNSGSDTCPFSAASQHDCALKATGDTFSQPEQRKNPLSDQCASSVNLPRSQTTAAHRCPHPSFPDSKARLYCSEASSGLKLHLSASCSTSTSQTTLCNPLTVSIKLPGQNSQPQNSAHVSPSRFSSQSDQLDQTKKRENDSSPQTPSSAPPLRGVCSRHRRTSSAELECDRFATDYTTGDSSHSADWFGVGSPVYESMYDKIKRRTNKEAEKRRQRQIEVLGTKDKKRRRKQPKDSLHLHKPVYNGETPCTPESFGSEHSTRATITAPSGKSHRLKSGHLKVGTITSKPKSRSNNRFNRSSKESPVAADVSPSMWPISKHTDTAFSLVNRASDTVLRVAHKTDYRKKSTRRNISPAFSLSSADECDSSSPPATLTRLSLGMRFPVSATYHECVRTSTSVRPKWSTDDESVGRISSISCSESDGSDRRAGKKAARLSETLNRVERTNGHISGSRTPNSLSCIRFGKINGTPRIISSDQSKLGCLARKPCPDSWASHGKNIWNVTDCAPHKNNFNDLENMRLRAQDADENQRERAVGKKRRHERMYGVAEERKRQRTRLHTELNGRDAHAGYNDHAARDDSKHFPTLATSYSDYILDSEGDNELQTSVIEAFTTVRWPQARRSRLFSGSAHSVTDDSSQPVTRSPSPLSTQFLSKSSMKYGNMSGSACGDSTGHMDEERDSVFGTYRDSDNFSSNSKSTPSTEPMEQEEFIERECCMKFSEDDWHSSIISTSPHPTTLDFDVDYCPVDKTEQSSTTYQSTSFSSQMLSPIGKLPSPGPDDYGEDDEQMQQNTKIYTMNDREQQQQQQENFGSPLFHAAYEELPTSQRSLVYETGDSSSSYPQATKFPCHSLLNELNASQQDYPTADVEFQSELNAVNSVLSSAILDGPCASTSVSLDTEAKHDVEQSETIAVPLFVYTESVPVSNSGPRTDITPSTRNPETGSHVVSSNTSCDSHLPVGEGSLIASNSLQPSNCQTGILDSVPPHPTVLQTTENTGRITVSKCDTPYTSNGASNLVKRSSSSADSSKSVTFSSSPTKPPTDTHDITRYVQSVIERVKAEKVEETQQAASAFYHPVCAASSSNLSSSSVSQVTRIDIPLHSNTGPQATSKRSGISQRKPLLVATSACSAVKAGATNASRSSASNSKMSGTILTSSLVSNASIAEASTSVRNPVSAGTTIVSVPSVGLHMPLIPGVNACAPLAASASLPSGRLTRQASQLAHSLSAIKRFDAAIVSDSLTLKTSPVSTTQNVQTLRRRRRSEGKGLNGTTKDTVQAASSSLPTVAQGTTKLPSQPTTVCKPAVAHEESAECYISASGSVHPSSVSSFGLANTTKPHSSVDPYEPNFDDESPPGFEHSLHPHRSISPVCSSPSTQTSVPGNVSLRKIPSPVILTLPTGSLTETRSVSHDTSTVLPAGDSSVPKANNSDSVDEVIRDVCAGQFDVQSYLNNWRSEQTARITNSPGITNQNQANSTGLVSNTSVTTAPRSSSVALPLATAKPFPLSLTSEPVVAAVTIPVSSGTGVNKSASTGQNGPNSVVNLGTGNALLNTLLAALQLIPGSQVTVTGPAAAAGVVGAIGTGTISATTITLPVNAARQAAANIKAAVLSATGAMTTNFVDDTQNEPPNKLATVDTEVNKSPSYGPVVAESKSNLKSSAAVNAFPSTISSAGFHSSVVSTSTYNPNSTDPNTTVKSAARTTYTQQSGGTPLRIPASLPIDATKIPNSFTDPSVLLPFRSTKDLEDFTATSVTSTRQSTHSFTAPVRSANTVPSGHLPKSISTPQPHHTPSVASYVFPPHLSGVPPQQHTYRPRSQTPSTLAPSQSPPLSTPPLISHTIQALADRLGGTVEPSVLMALAQAAVSGNNVCMNANEVGNRSETENQVFNYLRRLAVQLNDSHSSVSRQTNITLLDHQGKNPLTSSSPPLATPHLPHLSQHHQRFPAVTCPLYVSPVGTETSSLPRSCGSTEVNPSISPSLLSPRTFTTHSGPNVPAPTNHISWNALGQVYPLVWQGRLSLKNAETRVALHYVYGNLGLLHDCMRLLASGGGGQSLVSSGGPLRIVQRMRLELSQLEGVQRKIHQDGASCVCLALPAGSNPVELMQQTQILNDSFIRYMQEKVAAGIINVGLPEFQQGLYVVHIFPPCEFSHSQLNLAAPELHCRVVQDNQSHLLVVVTTV